MGWAQSMQMLKRSGSLTTQGRRRRRTRTLPGRTSWAYSEPLSSQGGCCKAGVSTSSANPQGHCIRCHHCHVRDSAFWACPAYWSGTGECCNAGGSSSSANSRGTWAMIVASQSAAPRPVVAVGLGTPRAAAATQAAPSPRPLPTAGSPGAVATALASFVLSPQRPQAHRSRPPRPRVERRHQLGLGRASGSAKSCRHDWHPACPLLPSKCDGRRAGASH